VFDSEIGLMTSSSYDPSCCVCSDRCEHSLAKPCVLCLKHVPVGFNDHPTLSIVSTNENPRPYPIRVVGWICARCGVSHAPSKPNCSCK